MTADPAPILPATLSTGTTRRPVRPRNLTLATAPAFSWDVERVTGAEGRELRVQQAAAIKELVRWMRQAEAVTTRAG